MSIQAKAMALTEISRHYGAMLQCKRTTWLLKAKRSSAGVYSVTQDLFIGTLLEGLTGGFDWRV
jgi:hypothetical protein